MAWTKKQAWTPIVALHDLRCRHPSMLSDAPLRQDSFISYRAGLLSAPAGYADESSRTIVSPTPMRGSLPGLIALSSAEMPNRHELRKQKIQLLR